MVKGGTVVTHKCVRTESSKVSTFDLQQTKFFESSSFSNRQHDCTTLPSENGRRNRELNVTEIKQRNFVVSLETSDHNYCRIPSKFFECGGRLAVSKQQGHFKIETLSKSISTSISTTPVFCLETRPFQSVDRWPTTTDLGKSILLCISPILTYSTSVEESELQPNKRNVACLSHQLGSLKSGTPFYYKCL